jgi:cation-transporting ATPase F
VGGAWWLFLLESSSGSSLEVARTAAINLFVTVEAVYLFNCRSLTAPLRTTGVLGNRWVLVGVAVQAAGQLALTYVPVMQQLFHTAPIGLTAWARIAAFAAGSGVVVGVDKWLHRR